MKAKEPIPVTVLTGFLGAGKTTLLNNLLTQNHGYKCAIIINEFGEVSIDHQLVVGVDEEIVQLNNGCLCCRVRGDLIKSLANLFKKQKRFDYVLVETTGLADPGPVAQTFNMPELAKSLRLDGIVTVADAKHLDKELAEAPEAMAQLAFADVILLNKSDLMGREALEELEARIRKINPLAMLHRTERSKIEAGKLLNLKARELKVEAGEEKRWKREEDREGGEREQEQEHERDHEHENEREHEHEQEREREHEHENHHHQDAVGSFYIREERPLDLKKLEEWLSELLGKQGQNIYRSKGILNIQGEAKRVVFQGVQMMFEANPERVWRAGETRQSQLVFIGKELDEAAIRAGFNSCLARNDRKEAAV